MRQYFRLFWNWLIDIYKYYFNSKELDINNKLLNTAQVSILIILHLEMVSEPSRGLKSQELIDIFVTEQNVFTLESFKDLLNQLVEYKYLVYRDNIDRYFITELGKNRVVKELLK